MRIRSPRRRAAVLLAATGVLVIPLVAACGSGGSASGASASGAVSSAVGTASADTAFPIPNLAGQTIVINTYGGSFATAFTSAVVEPFEKATGATVQLVTTCCDDFETTVREGQYAGDVVLGDDYGPMLGWAGEGLLESDPRLSRIGAKHGMDKDFYQNNLIAVDFYAYLLAWNTSKVKSPPADWADFYNTAKFPGTRGVIGYPEASMETALLADGVPLTGLYPLNSSEAFATLRKLQASGDARYWTTGADLMNKLGTGEYDYALGFSNRVFQAKASGLPIDASFNQAIRVASGAAIPKGAKNVNGAIAFLDYYMQPQIQANFAKISALAPAYPSANELLSPAVAATMVTSPQNITKTVAIDDKYWSVNFDAYNKTYTDIMAGH